jgi:hypothetical protein
VAALAAALAFALFSPAFAAAQGSDTIFDDADALSDPRSKTYSRLRRGPGQRPGSRSTPS